MTPARAATRRNDEIVLPETLQEAPDTLSRVIRAAAAILGHKERRFVSAMSRGPKAAPDDAVVELKDGRADLSLLAGAVGRGKFLVRVNTVNAGTLQMPSTVGSFPVDWSSEGPGRASLPKVAPGLFAVDVLRVGDGTPAASDVWVLLASPGYYPLASSSYREAAVMTETWTLAPARARKNFLRAWED